MNPGVYSAGIRDWTKMEFKEDGVLKSDMAEEMYARGLTAPWIREVTFQYLEIFTNMRPSREALSLFVSSRSQTLHGLHFGHLSSTASQWMKP